MEYEHTEVFAKYPHGGEDEAAKINSRMVRMKLDKVAASYPSVTYHIEKLDVITS